MDSLIVVVAIAVGVFFVWRVIKSRPANKPKSGGSKGAGGSGRSNQVEK